MSGFSAKANRASGGDLSQCADLGAERTEKTTAEHLHQRDAMTSALPKGKIGTTVSEIAQQLKVTKPSVTVAVKSWCRRATAKSRRLPGDSRSVQVMLTPEGKKVEAFHRRCHRRIIAEICEDLSEE